MRQENRECGDLSKSGKTKASLIRKFSEFEHMSLIRKSGVFPLRGWDPRSHRFHPGTGLRLSMMFAFC
jgi:hypothetical protein